MLRFNSLSNEWATEPMVATSPEFDLIDEGVASEEGDTLHGSYEYVSVLLGQVSTVDKLEDREGKHIAKKLSIKPLVGSDVLKSRLRSCQSPPIVHIDTHGIFLQNVQQDSINSNSFMGSLTENFVGQRSNQYRVISAENTLIRSGLALSGFNSFLKGNPLPEEAEDGYLSALDVSSLDWSNTDLVVLSACETGLGHVVRGEGVFGLRRAFMLSGVQTLVMSLWKVPTEETRELMEYFYNNILDGLPRAEALRTAQLTLKSKSAGNSDPFFWGAFICQGNPGSISAFSKRSQS